MITLFLILLDIIIAIFIGGFAYIISAVINSAISYPAVFITTIVILFILIVNYY